ncbi:hypothetical protein ACFYO9_11045 [Streptomyces sp. NPDC005863]|uniref:hypothetical protein n=1 Tax=unclassified Streptomyces TaxID=2593676 RepID=UPI0033FCCBC1
MSDGSLGRFSGRGRSEFEVPVALAGKTLLAEAWGRVLSQGFTVEGDYREGNAVLREWVGQSGWGNEKAHIVIPPKYKTLVISKGGRNPGRWHLSLSELTDAPKLSVESSGTTSRVYSYLGEKTEAEVDFEGNGAVWFSDFRWRRRQKLIGHTGKFRGTIVIPGPGLVAVTGGHGGALAWGSQPGWKVILSPA